MAPSQKTRNASLNPGDHRPHSIIYSSKPAGRNTSKLSNDFGRDCQPPCTRQMACWA